MLEKSQEIKRYVAEHSPKRYAKIIEKRNLELLKLARKIGARPDRTETYPIDIGCPHCACFSCKDCLWTKAVGVCAPDEVSGNSDCCDVGFGGVTYMDVKDEEGRYFGLEYSDVGAAISAVDISGSDPGTGRPFDEEEHQVCQTEYNQVLAFLDAHVRWARWACWGKKYGVLL